MDRDREREEIVTKLYSIKKICEISDPFTLLMFLYEGWNFNSGNYLFTTDTK